MELTILVDNTCDVFGLKGEHGFSVYLEDENHMKGLFDAGSSDVFLENASKLGIDLGELDYVVLSHGHDEHVGGIEHLIALYENNDVKPELILHPWALAQREYNPENIGARIPQEKLQKAFKLKKTKEPFWINDKLVVLGEIERKFSFEGGFKVGKILVDGKETDDYVADDTAIVYNSAKGLVVITGCAHSGLCNIVEYAKKVCNNNEVCAVVGGFFLANNQQEQLNSIVEYFKKMPDCSLYLCHCTDAFSRFFLRSNLEKVKEIGVGYGLDFPS
ncbi:MBL fold metallo-hydrolase [Selenomonadales bacterium OttesenSCG-928-I06]|nr:MBL fold metallo-hydrolase [Selenomonadales bacterium OttesenSCG-928-I06]